MSTIALLDDRHYTKELILRASIANDQRQELMERYKKAAG